MERFAESLEANRSLVWPGVLLDPARDLLQTLPLARAAFHDRDLLLRAVQDILQNNRNKETFK